MVEQSLPFLRGYDLFRLPIMDANGISAWPSIFPPEKIDALRDTVGARHFSSQMMLEYIAEERARLDPGALHFYNGEFDARTAKLAVSREQIASREFMNSTLPIKNADVANCGLLTANSITGSACYWDPSGGRSGADASVCVLLYRDDKNRRAFIHDVRYLSIDDGDLHPLATQCEKVLDFMALYGARIIAIEVNGMGSALPEILREVASRRAQPAVVQKIINHSRKELRILDAIEPLLTTGRLWAHERIRATPLLSEMLGWTPMGCSGHDDGLDAIAGALRLTPTAVRPLGQLWRPIRAQTEFRI
jgi:hypothetical protein